MAFEEYYINQAGNGIPSFQGILYQKGKGWLGNIWKAVGLPLLKYAGKQALNTGADFISDIKSGENIKEATKRRLKDVASKALVDAAERGGKFIQTGKGRYKKKRKSISNKKRKSSMKKPRKVVKKRLQKRLACF